MEGNSSEFFPIKHGVAQGCTLLPTLFLFISVVYYLSGLLLADDLVGVAETGSA